MYFKTLQLCLISFIFLKLITKSDEQNTTEQRSTQLGCGRLTIKAYQYTIKGIDIVTNDAFIPPYNQLDLKSDIFKCEHNHHNRFKYLDKIYEVPDNVEDIPNATLTCESESIELDNSSHFKTSLLQNIQISTHLMGNYAQNFDSDSFGFLSNSNNYIQQQNYSKTKTTSYMRLAQYRFWQIRSNLWSNASFLSNEFSNAIASLKYPFSEHSQSYQDIIDQFGTHYATDITYGGQIFIKRQYKLILDLLIRNNNNSFPIFNVLGGDVNKLNKSENEISCGEGPPLEWDTTIPDRPAVVSIRVESIEKLIENRSIRGEFKKAFDFYRYTAYLKDLERDFSNIYKTENNFSCGYFTTQNITNKLIDETSNLLGNRTSNLQDIKQNLSVLSDKLTIQKDLMNMQRLYLEMSKFYHCKIPRLRIDLNYCNPSKDYREELRSISEDIEAFIKQYNTTEFGNLKTTGWNKRKSNEFLQSSKQIVSRMFRFENTIETNQFVKCRDQDEARVIRGVYKAEGILLNNCLYPKNCAIVKNS